jgi:hypothetical protein
MASRPTKIEGGERIKKEGSDPSYIGVGTNNREKIEISIETETNYSGHAHVSRTTYEISIDEARYLARELSEILKRRSV